MGAIREGRTAVITVSDGWRLFRPNEELTKRRIDPATGDFADPMPGTPPPVGVGPGGTLTSRLPAANYAGASDRTECDKDQMDLAMADNERRFRDLPGPEHSVQAPDRASGGIRLTSSCPHRKLARAQQAPCLM